MNRTKASLAVMIAVVSLAVTWVAADFETSDTPLYMFRMEQASNKMGFLPTKITEFTYTAEYGYYQNCNILGNDGEILFITTEVTCIPVTCEVTCPDTCWGTCDDPTCVFTCGDTHWSTCPDTCEQTCPDTCEQTCPNTCEHTCRYTCDKPCQP